MLQLYFFADLRVGKSSFGITTTILEGLFFNSFKTFGKDSASDFAGITKVTSFTKINLSQNKFEFFLIKQNNLILTQRKMII